ncbi:MAG: methionyl-tRNA formyltransferase [Clostridia bacterium]|nr:methionyl-tRNA formyltransferase [Clostridia bacterium]
MSIIYMGTADFAVQPLKALFEANYDVALVVTKPDRPKGRGEKMQSCPVKLEAQRLGLCVDTPEKIKGNMDFVEKIKNINPELIVVAAYGKILPPEILEIPTFGCVNIHGSLLPKYRGAAPIHRAVMDGCEKTGVTLMYMAEGMDTGDMIAQAQTFIGNKTTGMLHEELSELGARLLLAELPKILMGIAARIPQCEAEASYAPMVFKEDGIIDFSASAEQICALVRGMNSWPCASTTYEGAVMKVHKASIGNVSSNAAPGTIISADKEGLLVSCKEGTVLLEQIQMPGKKAMNIKDYLLGNKIEIGTILG